MRDRTHRAQAALGKSEQLARGGLKYCVATIGTGDVSRCTEELTQKIQSLMPEGWRPVGSVSVDLRNGVFMAQAMERD